MPWKTSNLRFLSFTHPNASPSGKVNTPKSYFEYNFLFMSNINKGGRPKKEVKRAKEKRILFTELESEQIDKMFSESDYTNMNSMIRDILLNNQYRIITFDNDARIKKGILIEEVRRIGNNFNQLIKSFHQKKLDYFTRTEISYLIKNIDDIKQIYSKIEECIKNDGSKQATEIWIEHYNYLLN